jgi:transcriptional regulator GlxA family with amidase domain
MKHVWGFRIHRARQLLETGQFKVAQVAAETGFYDQSHLDRQFRKEFGVSPGSVIPKHLIHRRD